MKNIDNRYVKERKDCIKSNQIHLLHDKIPNEYTLNKTSGIIRILTRQRKRESINKI